jgi:hypothetical protein
MKRTAVRAYCSPTLVLLALDWADGDRDDFLGFAVERAPGMRPSRNEPQAPKSWLPNRVGFDGPAADGQADLSRDARWTGKAYKKITPEWRARVAMAKG